MYLCKWSPCKLSWKLFGTPVGRQCGDISNKMYTRVCVGVWGVREVWENQLPLCRDVVPPSFPP